MQRCLVCILNVIRGCVRYAAGVRVHGFKHTTVSAIDKPKRLCSGSSRSKGSCTRREPLSLSVKMQFYRIAAVYFGMNSLVCLQPVNFVSLGLTAVTAAGLVYFYQHLRDTKLQGKVCHRKGASSPCCSPPHVSDVVQKLPRPSQLAKLQLEDPFNFSMKMGMSSQTRICWDILH